MDQSAKEGSCGEDHRTAGHPLSIRQKNSGYPAFRNIEVVNLPFDDIEIRLLPQLSLNGQPVEFAIRLRSGAPHCGSLAPVEHAILDAGLIGHPAHQAIESIDLPDDLALAKASNRRVA
jgi:hypothetical protein